MSDLTFRDLRTLDDCRRIVDLEKIIWGYTDTEDLVPAIMLFLCAKRGGILIAAEREDGTMDGFAFSMASIIDGKPAQWSHMMGVVPGTRARGLGRALKLAQRERALAMGIELIEWTFDPLQAVNAHLNFAKLGVISNTYAVNIYGDSSSVLHRGTATDRLIAEWWIQRPHVERRIAGEAGKAGEAGGAGKAGGAGEAGKAGKAGKAGLSARDSGVASAPVLNELAAREPWDLPPDRVLAHGGAPRVLIRVPARFSEMQAERPDLAQAWRAQTRALFTASFADGYRAVDFFKDERAGGAYLLAKTEA